MLYISSICTDKNSEGKNIALYLMYTMSTCIALQYYLHIVMWCFCFSALQCGSNSEQIIVSQHVFTSSECESDSQQSISSQGPLKLRVKYTDNSTTSNLTSLASRNINKSCKYFSQRYTNKTNILIYELLMSQSLSANS